MLTVITVNVQEVHAANYVGEPVTITVSASWGTPAAGFASWSGNGGIPSGSTTVGNPINGSYVTSFSRSLTFTPSAPGTYTATLSLDLSDANGAAVSASGNPVSVTVVNRPAPQQSQPEPTPQPQPRPNPTPTPAPVEPEVLSNNNNLASLALTPGGLSPAFSAGTTQYSVTLPENTFSYTVSGRVADNGARILSGVGTFNATSTTNHSVVVQAEDGTRKTYAITINVNDTRSSDSTLSALGVSLGTLSPEFNAQTKEYSVSVPYGTTSIDVTATPNDEKATVSGTGTVEFGEEKTATREIVVTAENQSTSTYTINFTVEDMPAQNFEFNGKSLELDYVMPENVLEPLGFTLENDLEGFEPNTRYYRNADGKYVAIYAKEGETSNFYLLTKEMMEEPVTADESEEKAETETTETSENPPAQNTIQGDWTVLGKFLPFALGEKHFGYLESDNLPKQPNYLVLEEGLTIGEQSLKGWKYLDASLENTQLFYLMDASSTFDFFHYDTENNVLSKTGENRLANIQNILEIEEETDEPVEETGSFADSFRNLFTGANQSVLLLALSLIGLLIVVLSTILIKRVRSNKKANRETYNDSIEQ